MNVWAIDSWTYSRCRLMQTWPGNWRDGGNRGLGFEYRFSGTMAAAAGRFVNSDRYYSNYAGVLWQPYALGPVRLGAAIVRTC